MFAFNSFALLLLSAIAAARPQYIFASTTAYDEMSKQFTTTSTTDVTESVGDHGWQDFDGNTCAAGLSSKPRDFCPKKAASKPSLTTYSSNQPAATPKAKPTPNPPASASVPAAPST